MIVREPQGALKVFFSLQGSIVRKSPADYRGRFVTNDCAGLVDQHVIALRAFSISAMVFGVSRVLFSGVFA